MHEVREIFCFVYNVHKEKMFTIEKEDGREATVESRKKGAKRPEILVFTNNLKILLKLKHTF